MTYALGMRTELLVIERARAAGCLAWRVAGSKGESAVDVIVASPHTGVLALNVKRGQWAPPAERIAMRPLTALGILPVLVRADVRGGVRTDLQFRVASDQLTEPPNRIEPWSADWLGQ